MAWETINHWAHSPVYWGKKELLGKNLAFLPCFIRFHLTTKYLALYWLFLSFCFHSCCCQSPHPFSPPLKSPSSALPFNLPTCSSSSTLAGFHLLPWSWSYSSKIWASKNTSGESLLKILRKRKIPTRSWKTVPRSNEGEPLHTWLKTSKAAQGLASGQTLLMLGWVVFSWEICCV